ncbi:penicillin-binding protein [Intestinibacillus massiliensis]|nr:penicillin-binding protein [Intestinibacillus massiliensis]
MKKIERRAVFCLLLAAALMLGLAVFCFRFVSDGGAWASFPSNRHLYNKQGVLIGGRILDRSGVVLSETQDGGRVYADDKALRRATLHAVGDAAGNIGTGAQTAFADKLSGYNLVTGAYSLTGVGAGSNLYLTIDAALCKAAYQALDGRRGAVGVYNYETGEILCMVSTPAFDPANPPPAEEIESAAKWEGAYLNRFLSATFTPGSVFKTVTLAAAIDHVPTLFSREFTCDGRFEVGGQVITCPSAHGTMTIGKALTVSCNCVFGALATEVGPDVMAQYADKAGLTSSLSVSGIQTAKGSFTFPSGDPGNLAWAGIGQHNDLVNPCNFMAYMGAIARGGVPATPQLVYQTTTAGGIPTSMYLKKHGARMLDEATAAKLSDMMRDNVVDNYGEKRFPGMELCAKSGTAEVGGGKRPNAWFAGFSRDPSHPYAFVVMVENGGGGNAVAGEVAGQVLRAAFQE